VIQALVHDRYLTEGGQYGESIHWLPRRSHTEQDCSRMQELAREEWPTLW
jgi:hypothetical protein